MLVLNLTDKTIKKNKDIKIRKKLRKSQSNFYHNVKKIEARAKKWFSYKKRRVLVHCQSNRLILLMKKTSVNLSSHLEGKYGQDENLL